MLIHESWRDEIGWMLAVLGIAAVLLAVIDLFTQMVIGVYVEAWMVLVPGVVVLVIGLGLHVSRPVAADGKSARGAPADDRASARRDDPQHPTAAPPTG